MAFVETTQAEARERLRAALAIHFRSSEAHDPMACGDGACIPCRAVIFLTVTDLERKANAQLVDALVFAAMPVRSEGN